MKKYMNIEYTFIFNNLILKFRRINFKKSSLFKNHVRNV